VLTFSEPQHDFDLSFLTDEERAIFISREKNNKVDIVLKKMIIFAKQ
jgi:hypothetical protein